MSEKNGIYVVGIDDNSAVYIDLIEALGEKIEALVHYNTDRVGESFLGRKISMSIDELLELPDLSGKSFALSMGDNKIRSRLAEQIRDKDGKIPTLIHPAAAVSNYARLDDGVVVHANATVQAMCSIERDSVVGVGASVIHGACVGEGCYVAGNAIVGADVKLGESVFVGMGATLVSKMVPQVSGGTIIGAGAIVVRPIDEPSVWAGNPAKFIRPL